MSAKQNALPAVLAAAITTNVSSTVASAIETITGLKIPRKSFRDAVRKLVNVKDDKGNRLGGYTNAAIARQHNSEPFVWNEAAAMFHLARVAAKGTTGEVTQGSTTK